MKKSNFSLTQINKLSEEDPEFKKEMIEIFLGQIPEFVSKMTDYLSQKKFIELAKIAHTAKSSALVFGMDETGKKLKKIQLTAKNEKLLELKKLIESVVEEFEEVRRILKH